MYTLNISTAPSKAKSWEPAYFTRRWYSLSICMYKSSIANGHFYYTEFQNEI